VTDESNLTMDVKMGPKCFPQIRKLDAGQPVDESGILEILSYIDSRHDCADFRMVCVLRSLILNAGVLSEVTRQRMRRTVLSFRYAIDEPGSDGMCTWSENHQLLFAACAYLAGQLCPDEVFSNSGLTGKEHRERARRRLDSWFTLRFRYGFVEWHSNTYYEEDIAPLALLIDCADEPAVVKKASILLDLLLLDMALHSYKGYFCASSGRCYENQKKHPARQDVLDISEKAFGMGTAPVPDFARLSSVFLLCRNYATPPVIREIARDPGTAEIRCSMGLDLSEIDGVFPDRADDEVRGMYLWGMEAFTNPESANQTLAMWKKWNLSDNVFLKDIGKLDIPLVRGTPLLPAVVKLLNPVTNGIAIERANTVTRRTPDYMLSTAQSYHPGKFGDQQHIWQATVGKGLSVFTTHPGAAFFEDNARNFSPSWWVGNGVNPDAFQHGRTVLCLYDLRVRRGLLEKKRLPFTHAWIERDSFDDFCRHTSFLVTARSANGYIALLSTSPMEMQENGTELVQRGNVTGWAAICGSLREDGGYEPFVRMAKASRLTLSGRRLTLISENDTYSLRWRKGFLFNGTPIEKDFPRIDSPYIRVPREPEFYDVQFAGHSLRLNLRTLERQVDGVDA